MKIRYFATLRTITGKTEEDWNGPIGTVQELVTALCARYGTEFQRWLSSADGCFGTLSIVLVNGVDCRSLQGLETQLKPEDTVFIFPPLAGG